LPNFGYLTKDNIKNVSFFKILGVKPMKKIIYIVISLLFFQVSAYAALSGQAVTSANVGQLINIEVSADNALGDIRVQDHDNIHIMTLIIDNNDDDGFTLTFQSDNGVTFGVGDNFGYMLHSSAADDTSSTPNAGQKPSTRYELLLGEHDNTVEYGHVTQPSGLVTDCEVPDSDAGKFEIIDSSGTIIDFDNVDRATRTGYFDLCLTQAADIQLFHGSYTDTIVVSIADN